MSRRNRYRNGLKRKLIKIVLGVIAGSSILVIGVVLMKNLIPEIVEMFNNTTHNTTIDNPTKQMDTISTIEQPLTKDIQITDEIKNKLPMLREFMELGGIDEFESVKVKVDLDNKFVDGGYVEGILIQPSKYDIYVSRSFASDL